MALLGSPMLAANSSRRFRRLSADGSLLGSPLPWSGFAGWFLRIRAEVMVIDLKDGPRQTSRIQPSHALAC